MSKLKLSLYIFLFSVISFCKSEADIPLSSYISSNDKVRFKSVFDDVWKLADIALVHYAISSYKILKLELPVPQKDLCAFVKKAESESASLEVLYHITAILNDLPECSSSQLVNNAGTKVLQSSQKEDIGIEDLFYLVSTLINLKGNTTNVSFISKSLKNALKSNETLTNLGYAFHIGTVLTKREIEPLYDKITRVIAQADEIDGQYYQFENGLTLTSLVINGAYKLSEKLGKSPPITNSQLVKFLKYFMSRVIVPKPRGVFSLLQVLSTVADNDFHAFVSVNAVDSEVNKEKPVITFRVSNVFGEPVFSDQTPLTVTLISGFKKFDSTPAVSNKVLSAGSDKTTYTINSNGLGLSPGYYKFVISVAHPKGKVNNKVIVNSVNNDIHVKVTTKITVESFQTGVLDAEQSSSADLNRLEYPKKLSELLNVDSHQRLVIRFSLKDADFNKLNKVQQSFVKLVNKKTGIEATFVCQLDSSRTFRLTLDSLNVGSAVEYASGEYDVILIVGDALMSAGIQWNFAVAKFKFGSDKVPTANEEVVNYYKPKPEIKHVFREPERRPPAIVSNVFTIFVLSPLLILFILWAKLGVNLKNFPFSISSFGFHLGLGGIFVLFGTFWFQLNMFQTIKYLLLLGVVTFLSGNKMLCNIASDSKK